MKLATKKEGALLIMGTSGKKLMMLWIMSCMFWAALNQTIVGTALPKIILQLGGMEYYSWVFTSYMLGSSITAILVGKLSDMFGRKLFLILGLFIFIVGTLLAGMSFSVLQLIIYRFIQGLGSGIIITIAFISVGDFFPARERGRWQGWMNAVYGLSSVLGPILGGFIVDRWHWHWVFWCFLPFLLPSLVFIWWRFPASEAKKGNPIDYAGSLFLTVTLVPFLMAFSFAGTKFEWTSKPILFLLISSLLFFAGFIVIEKRAKSPIMPLFLFRNRMFSLSNFITFVKGAGLYAVLMYVPFYLQGVRAVSATESGFIMICLTLPMVIASIWAGHRISKTGKYKRLAIISLLINTVGMLFLAIMNRETSLFWVVAAMAIVGYSMGVGYPIFTVTVQNSVKKKWIGMATSVTQLFRQLGGAIGVGVMGTILNHRMKEHLGKLRNKGSAFSEDGAGWKRSFLQFQKPQALTDMEKIENYQSSLAPHQEVVFLKWLDTLRDALGSALKGIFFTGSMLIFVTFVLSFWLKETSISKNSYPRTVFWKWKISKKE